MRYAYILMTKIDGTPKDRAQRRQSSRGFLFRLRRWMCAVATGEEATTSSAAASTKAPLELQLRSENSALLPKDERRVSYQPRTSTEVALTKWWTLVDTSPATVEHCHFGIEEEKSVNLIISVCLALSRLKVIWTSVKKLVKSLNHKTCWVNHVISDTFVIC